MGSIQHLNPDTLHQNPAFTNVIVVSGSAKTIYIGGQNAVNTQGEIVGVGDIGAQTEQVMHNVQAALAAAGATLHDVIKWGVHIVQGQPLQPGFEVFQRAWGQHPNPPAITMAFVSALAHPDFLVEIDAVAVLAE